MKNLFIINEEEKRRILNLHESASKRHYLSEQEYKSTIDGVTMVVNKDGKQLRVFNSDTDENLVDWSSRLSGQSQPTKGKNVTDPNTLTKPVAKTATRADNINSVFCSLNNNIITGGSFKGRTWDEYKSTYKVTDAEETAASASCKGLGEVKAVPDKTKEVVKCPVGGGTTEEVKAFQDWLDTNDKGWLPKYRDGVNKDPKKGYGMCGPNTRKAWVKSGDIYKNELGSPEPLKNVEVKTIGDNQVQPELSIKSADTKAAEVKAAEVRAAEDKLKSTEGTTDVLGS